MAITNLGLGAALLALIALGSAALAFILARKNKKLKKNSQVSSAKVVSEKTEKKSSKAVQQQMAVSSAPAQAERKKSVQQVAPVAPTEVKIQKKPYSVKIEYTKNGNSLYTKTQGSSTVEQFTSSLDESVSRAIQEIPGYDSVKITVRENDKVLVRKFICGSKDVVLDMMRFASDAKSNVLEEDNAIVVK